MKFHDRSDAGEQLGEFLACCVRQPAVVLALPPGGIPVAAEVARVLGAPMDVVFDDRALPEVAGRTVILVDDGIETGSRAVATVRALQNEGATHIVVAAPVCSPAAEERIGLEDVELVYLECPEDFITARAYYPLETPASVTPVIP